MTSLMPQFLLLKEELNKSGSLLGPLCRVCEISDANCKVLTQGCVLGGHRSSESYGVHQELQCSFFKKDSWAGVP